MSQPSAAPPPSPAPQEPRLVPPSSTPHLAVRAVLLVAVLASAAYALLRPAGPDGSGRGYGAPEALLALAVLVALTATVIASPEPRLATRWAWFWLVAYVWPAAIAYLLLEPTPAWRREPVRAPGRRLTGGWAFLIGLLLGSPLTALLAWR